MSSKVEYFLGLILFILIGGCTAPVETKSEDTNAHARPNIVMILCDDLGFRDVLNENTPELNKMAKQGIVLTNFYVMPNCSPSRASLLTGSYPQRVGIPWVLGPKGPDWTKDKYNVGLNPDEETIPDLLKSVGYKTACVGKWHLGHYPQYMPLNQGFEQFFGLPYSNDMWPITNTVYPPLTLIEGDQPIDTLKNLADQGRLTERFTKRAREFILGNKSAPFFLYLAYSMPHVPINVSDKFLPDDDEGLYSKVVREIDYSVGNILNTIDSLGLSQNTLIVFTSDNGPWLTYGNHAGSAGPFREGKHTIFEGGVRVPLVARWKGQIQPGTRSDAIAGIMDLLPTFSQIANAPTPSLKIDGKSIWGILSGADSIGSDVHFYYLTDDLQAVRKGKWKLHFPHKYLHITNPGHDGIRGEESTMEIGLALFDLSVDPSESNNIAEQYPEVVEELSALGETFAEDIEKNKRAPGIAKN